MFDSKTNFTYVHCQRKKLDHPLAIEKHIYKFFIQDYRGKMKYIVHIFLFENDLLRIDFYPKIASDQKYRLLTNQFKFGMIGGTVLDIMLDIQNKINCNTFGIIGAETISEELDFKRGNRKLNEPTRRFIVYKDILSRKLDPKKYTVFANSENSTIFVIPNNRISQKETIILEYGKIFEQSY